MACRDTALPGAACTGRRCRLRYGEANRPRTVLPSGTSRCGVLTTRTNSPLPRPDSLSGDTTGRRRNAAASAGAAVAAVIPASPGTFAAGAPATTVPVAVAGSLAVVPRPGGCGLAASLGTSLSPVIRAKLSASTGSVIRCSTTVFT